MSQHWALDQTDPVHFFSRRDDSNNSNSDNDPNQQLWPYKPSKTLPIIFAGIFIVCLVLHVLIALRKSAVKFMWAFCLGTLIEAVGYVFRKESADNPVGSQNLQKYNSQSICIVIAPALLGASCYQIYGRIVLFVDASLSPIKPTWVTKVFVTTDIISFLAQFAGAGLMVATSTKIHNIAKLFIIIGFTMQCVCFSIFFVLSLIFYSRTRKADLPRHGWNKALFTLWGVAVLVLIRSFFRLAEYSSVSSSNGGSLRGPLIDSEAMFYGLESVPTALVVIIMVISHPSYHIPTNKDARLLDTYSTLPIQQAGYPAPQPGQFSAPPGGNTYPPMQNNNQSQSTVGTYGGGGKGYAGPPSTPYGAQNAGAPYGQKAQGQKVSSSYY